MTDHDRAIDRLTERLTGVWTTTLLRASKDGDDRFGFHLRHAMAQTEALAKEFCKFVTPTELNGKPKPAAQGR